MISSSIINELGNDIFRQATIIFLKNSEIDMQSLNKAFINSDFEEVNRLSHKLIGTFGSMRVEKIPELLREINKSSEKFKLETITFEKVKDLYEDLKIYIQENFSI